MSTLPNQLRKAAVLVASLDSASADRLLDQMGDALARQVRDAVIALGEPSPEEQEAVIAEFFQNDARPKPQQLDGVELDVSLSEKLGMATESTNQPTPADSLEDVEPFRFLHQAHSGRLAPYLAKEHPQTIALILAHVPPARAADMLASLPKDLQADVVRRLVDQREVNPEIVREVERGLMDRLGADALDHHHRASGINGVLEIIRSSQPAQGQSILNNLARHGIDLGNRTRPERFTFDDVHRLDSDSLSALVNAADVKLLSLALLDRPQSFVERVTSYLPPNAAHELRMSQRSPGPVRLSDVEAAQQQLVELASRLTVEGRARWPEEHLLVDA